MNKRGPYNVNRNYVKGLPGERYGKLLILSEIPAEKRKVRSKREFVCQCDCGKIRTVKGDNLFYGNTTSCGCLRSYGKKKIVRESRKQKIVWNRFGKLIVVEEIEGENYRKSYRCICDCGNERIVSNYSLVHGSARSCGCVKEEKMKEKEENIAGQTFNELTAIKRVDDRIGENGERHIQWLFKCSCGKEKILTPYNVINGKIKSCGHIGSSYAENNIERWLNNHNVCFRKEASFPDLRNPRTNRRYKFDFKIYRNDGTFFLLEHQGVQHFQEIKHDPNFGKQQREETDKTKKDYCRMNGIVLYETRYDEDYILKLEEIVRNELGPGNTKKVV